MPQRYFLTTEATYETLRQGLNTQLAYPNSLGKSVFQTALYAPRDGFRRILLAVDTGIPNYAAISSAISPLLDTDAAEEIDEATYLAAVASATAGASAWGDITGKPTEFPPASHTHSADSVFVEDGTFNNVGQSQTSVAQSFENVAAFASNASTITQGTLAALRLPFATTNDRGAVIVGTGLGVSTGTVSVSYGTTAGTACQGNDSRLSDARTPTAHKSSHATGGSDALTAADIGAAETSHTHSVSQVTGAASLPTTGLTITKTGDWNVNAPVLSLVYVPPQAYGIGSTYRRYGGKWIAGFSYSETNFYGFQQRITALSFDDLEGATGQIALSNMAGLTSLSFPSLRWGAISFTSLTPLTTLSLPVLELIGPSGLSVSSTTITALTLPSLEVSQGGININCPITTLSLPSLVASASVSITSSSLISLSAPLWRSAGGISITVNALTTLSVPELVMVSGTGIGITSNGISSLSFPKLEIATGISFGLSISSTSLTSLTFPALVAMTGTSNSINASSLTNFSLPATLTNSTSLSITAPLDTASVDNVLQRYAALDGTNGTLSFGSPRILSFSATSAPPTNLGAVTVTLATSPTLPNLVCSGTTCTVNMTAHGYVVGDVLRVSGVTGATNANRYAIVATVPNANQFTYTTVNTATPTNGAGSVTFAKAGNDAKAIVTRGATLTTS